MIHTCLTLQSCVKKPGGAEVSISPRATVSEYLISSEKDKSTWSDSQEGPGLETEPGGPAGESKERNYQRLFSQGGEQG